jgi:2-oxoglutarate ferredoxin oxidoreductase subunit beta
VLYQNPAPTFDEVITQQNRELSTGKTADLAALIRKGQTWEVNQKQSHII